MQQRCAQRKRDGFGLNQFDQAQNQQIGRGQKENDGDRDYASRPAIV